MIYKVDSVAEFYESVAGRLLSEKVVSPRGKETKEMLAPQIWIKNPRERLVYKEGRGFNLLFALVEAVMLFSPKNDLKYFTEYNKNMAEYSDDGKTLNGAYGRRIMHGLEKVIDKLKEDKYTRQAILVIASNYDHLKKTKDFPCTETLQFLIRDVKLHMITTMRSNDILYGFQYDVFMFTMLQETIANTLGIELGHYIHQPASLHVYKEYHNFNGYEMLERMSNGVESISVTNDNDYAQWKNISNWYTKESYDKDLVKGISLEIMKLMTAEYLHKEWGAVINKEKANIPEWAEKFVKRWLK